LAWRAGRRSRGRFSKSGQARFGRGGIGIQIGLEVEKPVNSYHIHCLSRHWSGNARPACTGPAHLAAAHGTGSRVEPERLPRKAEVGGRSDSPPFD
jgi:hypothetical protein